MNATNATDGPGSCSQNQPAGACTRTGLPLAAKTVVDQVVSRTMQLRRLWRAVDNGTMVLALAGPGDLTAVKCATTLLKQLFDFQWGESHLCYELQRLLSLRNCGRFKLIQNGLAQLEAAFCGTVNIYGDSAQTAAANTAIRELAAMYHGGNGAPLAATKNGASSEASAA